MKNIIITGGSGLLATELTRHLLRRKDMNVVLVTRHPESIKKEENLSIITLSQLLTDKELADQDYVSLVHTAFSRSNDGLSLWESLEYHKRVLDLVNHIYVKSFINISSQSIYGRNNNGILWNEESISSPNYPYAIAKYIAELMTEDMLVGSSIKYTNLRLASIIQNAGFIELFVNNAKLGKEIVVYGGQQRYSFIDIHDVVNAIGVLIYSTHDWLSKYNLGTGQTCSLYKLAKIIANIAFNRYGNRIPIIIKKSNINDNVGMDNSLFCNNFSWIPEKTIEDSINSFFN